MLEAVVTAGNVHDSVAFDAVYDKVTEVFPDVETVVADSAYKTPHICKRVFEDGRVLSTAYKRPQTMKGGHEWWKYAYDEYYDCVICPEYQPYKTAWYLLVRIRKAMGQRDDKHQLSGLVELDDAFFGGPTSGKKRGRGMEKAKVFVALSLDTAGKPQSLKMQVAKNIKRESVRRFAECAILPGSTIRGDGYRSYTPALTAYTHKPNGYNPDSGLLRWLHINKAIIKPPGTLLCQAA